MRIGQAGDGEQEGRLARAGRTGEERRFTRRYLKLLQPGDGFAPNTRHETAYRKHDLAH